MTLKTFSYFAACFILFFIVVVVQGKPARYKINPICKPPRGTTCIEIRKCPYFADLLDRTSIPRPRHVIQAIREYQCGFAGSSPKVCCTSYIPKVTRAPKVLKDNGTGAADIEKHENFDLLPRNCGLIPDETRITQGVKATPMEFPWMALLAYYTDGGLDFHCAGTLINERYILTAAHCVFNQTVVGVRLGEHDVTTETDCDRHTGVCSPPVQDFYIEDIVTHPKYNKKSFINDIALVRLATSANLTYDNSRPICLPIGKQENAALDGKYAVVAGWGVTEKGYKSTELLKIQIPILSTDHCRKIYKGRSPITDKQLCAGGFLGRDSCGGDSGGPLMISTAQTEGGPRFIQHGIVSYGPRHCGTEGQPGIYTKIDSYVPWILDSIKPWDD